MKHVVLFFILIFSMNTSFGQEIKKESLFEGIYNGKPIEIYIQSFAQECTGITYYKSIVRYLDSDESETSWRKFVVFANDSNGFLLVDDYWHSGRYNNYIFIEQNGSNFNGFIKNEKTTQKSINLKRNTTTVDFSEYRKEVQVFDDTDDC